MTARESTVPHAWFARGDVDVRAAERLLDGPDPEAVAVHIQQAIEKYLKGYLLRQGWRLRRIHDLGTLLKEAVGYDPSLERFRELCIVATEYYVAERYPYDEGEVASQEVLAAQLLEVKALRQALAEQSAGMT